MTENTIKPEKITKPIQLLGAWLAGLFSIDTIFLVAAVNIPSQSWEFSLLIVAAIVNVPLFLIAVFVLQTKFRPELQEDSYYASYLSQRTNEKIVITKDEHRIIRLQEQLADLESRLAQIQPPEVEQDAFDGVVFGINKYLSDRDALAEKLADVGILGYTLFGGMTPPDGRVVSISQHLPQHVINEVLRFVGRLGFSRYNLYDNIAEESEEDVLIGSYGPGDRIIVPHMM